jgi:hypothetical protein
MKVGQECPKCGGTAFVVVSSGLVHGKRYRRRHCKACGYRASDVDGKPPAKRNGNPGSRAKDRKFNAEQIAEIVALKGVETQRTVGEMFNCSRETIRQIWCGMLYQDLLPENYRPVPGPGDPSCEHCREWRGETCSLGFPDPIEEGPGFARDCNLYVKEG